MSGFPKTQVPCTPVLNTRISLEMNFPWNRCAFASIEYRVHSTAVLVGITIPVCVPFRDLGHSRRSGINRAFGILKTPLSIHNGAGGGGHGSGRGVAGRSKRQRQRVTIWSGCSACANFTVQECGAKCCQTPRAGHPCAPVPSTEVEIPFAPRRLKSLHTSTEDPEGRRRFKGGLKSRTRNHCGCASGVRARPRRGQHCRDLCPTGKVL